MGMCNKVKRFDPVMAQDQKSKGYQCHTEVSPGRQMSVQHYKAIQ